MENWLPIVGFNERYEVSDAGRIHKLCKFGRRAGDGILRPVMNNGYARIGLRKIQGQLQKNYLVHRLVMLTFVGPPTPGHEVNHINGIKTDNRLCNLEYVTRSDNQRHRYKILGHRHIGRKGADCPTAKLTVEQVKQIREELADAKPGMKTATARKFGVSPASITHIIKRQTWCDV